MWVWREDREDAAGGAIDGAVGRSGGWRLDAYGAWTWDEGPADPWRRARPDVHHDVQPGVRHDARQEAPGAALALLPGPVSGGSAGAGQDETPIFHAVSDDHSRRALHRVEGAPEWASIPEPHPGSGPLPVQHTGGARRLAAVPTVPPPGADDEDHDETPSSPEDEMRRRAERRRRGRSVDEIAAGVRRGRHAMRTETRAGRHSRES